MLQTLSASGFRAVVIRRWDGHIPCYKLPQIIVHSKKIIGGITSYFFGNFRFICRSVYSIIVNNFIYPIYCAIRYVNKSFHIVVIYFAVCKLLLTVRNFFFSVGNFLQIFRNFRLSVCNLLFRVRKLLFVFRNFRFSVRNLCLCVVYFLVSLVENNIFAVFYLHVPQIFETVNIAVNYFLILVGKWVNSRRFLQPYINIGVNIIGKIFLGNKQPAVYNTVSEACAAPVVSNVNRQTTLSHDCVFGAGKIVRNVAVAVCGKGNFITYLRIVR